MATRASLVKGVFYHTAHGETVRAIVLAGLMAQQDIDWLLETNAKDIIKRLDKLAKLGKLPSNWREL